MLSRLTIAYMLVPHLIFSFGWLKLPFALLLSLALIGGYFLFCRTATITRHSYPFSLENNRQYLALAIIVVMMTLFSGAGALLPQTADWNKHSAILNELLLNDWPVRFSGSPGKGGDWLLCYYFAYYLPAAVIGKYSGLPLANGALFLWTLLGFSLTVIWLRRLSGKNSWIVIVIWIFLSGMDLVGAALGGVVRDNLQWWARFAQYSSNTTLLQWVPQHALPGWLATSVIVDQVERKGGLANIGFVAALTGLWSPFVTLGLLPLVVVAAIRLKAKGLCSLLNLAIAPVILLPVAAFLQSTRFQEIHGYTCFKSYGLLGGSWFWLKFCLLEFLLVFILLGMLYLKNNGPYIVYQREWFVTWGWALMVPLTLLPFFHVGIFNDLAMRASIPALFLLWLLVIRTEWLVILKAENRVCRLLVACLLIGAAQPALDFIAATRNRSASRYAKARIIEIGGILQYKGDTSSFFAKHLLKNSR